jgi:glycosidase
MEAREMKYYGDVGFLYPFDVRYDPNDLAFCNPLPGGRVQLRVWTEPQLHEAAVVYNDGAVRGAPMRRTHAGSRFVYWEATISPDRPRFRYSFAFRTAGGRPVYLCRHGIDHAVEPLDRWELDLSAREAFITPAWSHGAVIYQIFPDRFANGEPANDPPGAAPWGTPPAWLEFQGGDLQGVARRADYLQELGVDVVYLTPIFASPSTHKYDCMDYRHVDQAFGGDDALKALVEALHRRGMRLILDASFNHCHPRFFAFQDLVEKGPASPYRDWFTVYDYPVRVKVRPHLAPPGDEQRDPQYRRWLRAFDLNTGVPVETVADEGPPIEPSYLAWYGVLDMPKLNQRNPATRAYFLDVTAYWLREFGIDGWRMDVARHIEADFWRDFARAAKAASPDCYLLAEIWGDTSPWLQGDMFDATMNYFFRDLCVDWFAVAAMDTPAFLDGIARMLARYAPQVTAATHNLFSSHDVERFRHAAGEEIRRLRLATLFQLTMPGAPGLYYGDEIGMSGGPDPDCRRAFPWDRPEAWDAGQLALVRDLARLRHQEAALRLGEWRAVWAQKDAFAFERTHEGSRIVVIINRGGPLPLALLPATSPTPEVLWGRVEVAPAEGGIAVTGLGSLAGAVIRV